LDYHPDGDLLTPGLLYDVQEHAPNNNGAYARVPAMGAAGYAALAATCVGSLFVKDSVGIAKLFAGSAGKIYQASGAGTWTDRSGAVTFTASAWDGCSFGDNTILANGSSKLQVATTGNFADIAGAPTGPKIVFAHANGLIALNTTANNAAWHRSVTGDHTNWTAAANNDADSGTLYGGIGGPITAGGPWQNLALAWKSRAMYAGTYVGNADPDQEVIRWQLVSNDVGCVSQWGWIATEVGVVFVSERDIMLFSGNKPVSIADKVRRTFIAAAAANRSRIYLTLDEARNHVYIWISPSGQSFNTQAWIWNYKTDQWGRLATLNDSTGYTAGFGKVPVRNANYQDYIAIVGTSKSREICNLFFDSLAHRMVNLADTTYTTNALMKTGFVGRPDKNTTLHRVHLISDLYSVNSSANTLLVNVYDPAKQAVSGSYNNLPLSNNAFWNVEATARWFDLTVTSPPSAGTVSISRVACEVSVPDPENKHVMVG
jgi:hypothetical protein